MPVADLLHVSDGASLAIHAALLLGRTPVRRLRNRDIAATLRVSETHLAKVLRALERARLVTATRGPTGGFELARPARDINLKEVYEAVEGPLRVDKCPMGVPACNGNGCVLGGFFRSVERKMVARLKQTRLSDLKLKLGG
jgi:Rrf2 family protein